MEHVWGFFRAGGVEQVSITSGADIAHLGELDQKLWVALACPTRGTEFDARTLDFIDTDRDGRIRAPELIAAAQWACARLRDPDDLVRQRDMLLPAAIADGSEEARALAEEARHVLQLRGHAPDAALGLDDLKDRAELFAAKRFNGDGVVTPGTAGEDAEAAEAITQILQTLGGVADRNGEQGVDRARVETFFQQVDAMAAWYADARRDAALQPLGASMLDAYAAMAAVRAKVDDFFVRCRLARYDPQAAEPLNATLQDYQALAAQSLDAASAALGRLPLARVGGEGILPLHDGVNPFWFDALQALSERAVRPLLGEDMATLREADWRRLQDLLAPCSAWHAVRPDVKLAALDAAQTARWAAPAVREAVLSLVRQDEDAEPGNARIVDLEKLLYLQRDLFTLLRNFVSFEAFYRREGAIFQAGTLYLDGRSCDLSVRVEDAAKHALLAGRAKAYLAYCTCTRVGEKAIQIVSAFTAGDVDFLFVGRNGVFYDRAGKDWDATITRVIENPTSIGQAFFSPYKKFLNLVEEQVAKRAAAGESRAQGRLGTVAGQVAVADKAVPPAAVPAAAAGAVGAAIPPALATLGGKRVDVGTVAAIGVALGSLSAVAVGVFARFIELGWWIPMAVAGIVLAISGPSMLIAWLKLRQRSLGPILDASGWAINGRMRINVRLGASLSQSARVPSTARRRLADPFADRHGRAYTLWTVGFLLAVLLVGWRYGLLNPLLPEGLRVAPRPPQPVVVVPAGGSGTAVPGAAPLAPASAALP